MEQIIDDGWPVIRNFVPEDAHRMEALHARCLQACPDMNLIPGGFYWAPGFAQGRNILCAYQGDRLVGHVAIYPQQGFEALGGAFKLWVDVRVDPTLPDRGRLRGVLLERAIARAREIGSEIGQPVALSATYFAAGQESIDDLRARGFVHYETVFLMLRNLSDPIPNLAAPQGVRIQSWRMESEAEQAAYVEACNEAFGKPLRDLGELRHWMHSETWAVGTTFAAFARERLVGNVLVAYDPVQEGKEKTGITEWVFVLAPWRRRGIARYLLCEGLRYLKGQGMDQAQLEVVSLNRDALRVYESIGYQVAQEAVSLGYVVPPDRPTA